MGTTFAAIRDRVISVLETTAPSSMRTDEHYFRYVPERHRTIREWALDNPGSSCFRKFGIQRSGTTQRTSQRGPDEVMREESMEITIAYPRLESFYGDDGLLDMEDVIRGDCRTVHDLLWSPSTFSTVTDWSGVVGVDILGPERDGDVWFQTIVARLVYCEAATYT